MMNALLAVVLALGSSDAPARHPHADHRFEDAALWAQRFDDPARDAWQKPEEVLRALGLPTDAKVADLGSATGYFTVRLARAVPKGHVFAIDVEKTLNDHLRQRLQKEKLKNVTVVLGDATDSKLPEPVDLILIVDTYHHIADRTAYFKKLADKLRPSGRIVVIDFKKGAKMGPPDEAKLDRAQVTAELGEAGFQLSREHRLLPHQYFLEYTRKPTQ